MQDPRKLTKEKTEEEIKEEYVYEEREIDKFITDRFLQCIVKADEIEAKSPRSFGRNGIIPTAIFLYKDTQYAQNYGFPKELDY